MPLKIVSTHRHFEIHEDGTHVAGPYINISLARHALLNLYEALYEKRNEELALSRRLLFAMRNKTQ